MREQVAHHLESLWRHWSQHDNYFDDLAVLGLGPLHPGGLVATREIVDARTWSRKRVLDVGCGNGTTLRYLESLGAIVLGVEASPYMRESARQNGVSMNQIVPGRLESIDLRNRRFDVILFEGVIGFVAEPSHTLRALASNLRSSGVFVISDWVPHERDPLPEYGFVPVANTSPDALSGRLQSDGFRCETVLTPAVARSFTLELNEAIRRASRFFAISPHDELVSVVTRKMQQMRLALPRDINTERFVMTISRS